MLYEIPIVVLNGFGDAVIDNLEVDWALFFSIALGATPFW